MLEIDDVLNDIVHVRLYHAILFFFFFFQAEDGIRDHCVTGVQTRAFRSPPSLTASGVRKTQ